jgi:hypothetical protein
MVKRGTPASAQDLIEAAGEARARAADAGDDDEASALHRTADELEAVALAANEHDNYARSHAVQDAPASPAEHPGE